MNYTRIQIQKKKYYVFTNNMNYKLGIFTNSANSSFRIKFSGFLLFYPLRASCYYDLDLFHASLKIKNCRSNDRHSQAALESLTYFLPRKISGFSRRTASSAFARYKAYVK